jgi:protein-L-isoaspartate(D-aspartate) O-methyltransferase
MAKNDLDSARKEMIERHLVARGIHDKRVLQAMGAIPRERFVDRAMRWQAYDDRPLPIGQGQTISQPYIVALMSEALELRGNEKVLEIGTGSGYQTAVLAELSEAVYSVERVQALLERARAILDGLGYSNIFLKTYNGTLGWSEYAPYQAIIVTAGAPGIPRPLIDQLDEGGRFVIPVGDRFGQDLVKITKINGRLNEKSLGAVRFVSLIGEYGWTD